MSKIAEIRNETQDRTFDLIRESDALYLSVKCTDQDHHSRIIKIKLSDVLYQVWRHMTSGERRRMCQFFFDRITFDQKSA